MAQQKEHHDLGSLFPRLNTNRDVAGFHVRILDTVLEHSMSTDCQELSLTTKLLF